MKIQKISDLAITASELLVTSGKKPPRIAVAAAREEAVLAALSEAKQQDLAQPVLLGERYKIEESAEKGGINLSGWEMIEENNPAAAAVRAVELIRDGEAELVMKGLVSSAAFLKAVLRKDLGLNRGSLISHGALMEVPNYHKLFIASDCALNIAPNLAEKEAILGNAVDLAHCLGVETPKAAILCAAETVDPDRMPCTIDAAILTQMQKRGQISGCIVDGPLALDNAISASSAATKSIDSPVAGDADILLVPNIEAGNILYKSLTNLCGGKTAGLILGTRTPVILTSRADSAETKTASIALAILAWLGSR
ncbi:MAG: bifunctional enoyl-CoA hydratase/phosphate acetyltransferase [Treponema sp.]|nr:bifunctional enoyl-CoA hydratase/phosphate acetyltransferase [Treponema sp.]